MISDAAATTSAAPRPAHLLPLLAGVLAAASFVMMDATIKSLTPRYDALQLTFLRFASGSVFALALWLWQRSPLPRGASAWRMHLLRCALLLVSLVSYFHALTLLPLAQAVAISYLAPIFVSLLAVFVLHERPASGIWFALALGLAGVVVSLWPELRAYRGPDGDAQGTARLQGIASAALAALAFSGVMVLARLQAQRDSLWTILLVQNLLPCALLALPAAVFWQPFDAGDTLRVVWIGACATVGLLALTYAFTHMEASRVAPLEYTSFVWAALLGYTLFAEVPTAATALSALLIVGGCLLLLRR
jgi:drug/metabolite transporter (DMT)-like permease